MEILLMQHEKLTLALTVTIFCHICNALMYMHDQNLVHGLVTAHAIQLITANFAKLGNFEYTIDRLVALYVLSFVEYQFCLCNFSASGIIDLA